jgi:hypothetical protein
MHTCAINSSGNLQCWGDNSQHQVPTAPSGIFTQVSAGYEHTCAIKINGTLQCWGADDFGQATPPTTGTFFMVSAGRTTTCGIRSTGELICWGEYSFNEVDELTLGPASLPAAGVGAAYSQTLSAQGGTPPYLFAVVGGSLPQGLSLSSSGLLSGTPLTVGEYTFTVLATDASTPALSGRKLYTLEVLAVYAADDAYQVFTQDTLQVQAPGVLANDSNQAGGTLSAVLVGNVAHGTLTFRSNGSFDYQAAANFVGHDSFTYRAVANDVTSNLATVTIEVYSSNMYLPLIRR